MKWLQPGMAAAVAAGLAVLPLVPSPAAATGWDAWKSEGQSAGRDGFDAYETAITRSTANLRGRGHHGGHQ